MTTPRDPVPAAFSSLNLDPRLLSALTALGYEEPTPIQQQSIPPLLAGTRRPRAGRHRHRQDGRVRAPDPQRHRDRAGEGRPRPSR